MLLKFAKPVILSALLLTAAAVAQAQTVVATIPLPGLPEQVAVSPLFNRIYVAVPNFGAQPFDYLTVIDGSKNTVIKNIEIPPVGFAVAVNDLFGLVYVGGTFVDANGVTQNEVVIINPLNNTVLKTISISTTAGSGIEGIATNALNGDVYVTNASDNEVDVIHGTRIKTRIPLSGAPFGVAVNPLLNKAYVSLIDGSVTLIDGKTHTVTATVPSGTSGGGIAVNPVTGHVFAVNAVGSPDTPFVGVFDKADSSLATVPVGNFPLGVDVDLITNLAFVANTGDDTLSVIDGKSNTVTATAPISALFLAVNPVNQRVYVSPLDPNPVLTVISE